MTTPAFEPDGTPVPASEAVMRIAVIDPIEYPEETFDDPQLLARAIRTKLVPALELSRTETHSEAKRLSVFVRGRTTPEQMWLLRGAPPHRRLVLFLEVDRIRSMVPEILEAIRESLPGSEEPTPLDVQWELATIEQGDSRVPDDRPGANGHAGIAHLIHSSNKKVRAFLREQLALRISRLHIVSLPDDGPAETE